MIELRQGRANVYSSEQYGQPSMADMFIYDPRLLSGLPWEGYQENVRAFKKFNHFEMIGNTPKFCIKVGMILIQGYYTLIKITFPVISMCFQLFPEFFSFKKTFIPPLSQRDILLSIPSELQSH